jgi:hypothetical protein
MTIKCATNRVMLPTRVKVANPFLATPLMSANTIGPSQQPIYKAFDMLHIRPQTSRVPGRMLTWAAPRDTGS